ncbi:hypothetical protein BDK51DRAFT_43508 [Blyttiomyces helicus]|uniref:Uncharacterized protein n=1 Tax=Blyttiomyces helicus TaxID=388810 RepID=A0A4P9W7N6_9FUNG|nr:hypothetical protein BDK51DRAFT_43508 [Blyttiomyces helicus]|eukprot:RKO87058.1 hypothetical protein BDK51DRAFT_43508 [Blyttiomyces helicus]
MPAALPILRKHQVIKTNVTMDIPQRMNAHQRCADALFLPPPSTPQHLRSSLRSATPRGDHVPASPLSAPPDPGTHLNLIPGNGGVHLKRISHIQTRWHMRDGVRAAWRRVVVIVIVPQRSVKNRWASTERVWLAARLISYITLALLRGRHGGSSGSSRWSGRTAAGSAGGNG